MNNLPGDCFVTESILVVSILLHEQMLALTTCDRVRRSPDIVSSHIFSFTCQMLFHS